MHTEDLLVYFVFYNKIELCIRAYQSEENDAELIADLKRDIRRQCELGLSENPKFGLFRIWEAF